MPSGNTPTGNPIQTPTDELLDEADLKDAFSSPLADTAQPGEFANALNAAYAINQQWKPAESENRAALRSAHHIYFRMCADIQCGKHHSLDSGINESAGWITIGPDRASNAIEHTRYIEDKHMTPMPEYGRMPVGMMGASNSALRFRWLLEHPSGRGLFEMPISQIAAYGWDKIPEVRAIRTDCAQITRIPCGHGCVNRDFLTDSQYKGHIQVRHAEVATSVAIGDAVKGAVAGAGGGGTVSPTDLATAVVAVLHQLQAQEAAP
jgi:hypothetical protein